MNDVLVVAVIGMFAVGFGVTGWRASCGAASPRNLALRAPSITSRAASPVPATWHCKHTWALTQRVIAPYFLGQSLLLVVTAAVIEGLRLWGIDPAESFTISFSVCALLSYVTFGIGSAQRRRRLGALRCEHLDGRQVRYVELPPRRKRAPGAPPARG